MAGRQLILWFVVAVVIAALQMSQLSSEEAPTILIVSAQSCVDHESAAFVVDKFQSVDKDHTRKENMILDGKLRVDGSQKHVNVTGMLKKCRVVVENYEPTYACDDIRSVVEHPGFCDHASDEGYIWSNITRSIPHFPKHCPIPSGDYNIDKAPVNLEFLHKDMNLTKGVWVFDLIFSSQGKEFACLEFSFFNAVRE